MVSPRIDWLYREYERSKTRNAQIPPHARMVVTNPALSAHTRKNAPTKGTTVNTETSLTDTCEHEHSPASNPDCDMNPADFDNIALDKITAIEVSTNPSEHPKAKIWRNGVLIYQTHDIRDTEARLRLRLRDLLERPSAIPCGEHGDLDELVPAKHTCVTCVAYSIDRDWLEQIRAALR